MNWRAPAWVVDTPIAHRGLHDEARPENSLAAFEAAADAGYAIELDVHLSADGEVIVFHDDDLQRACARPETVGDLPASELGSLRLFDTDERIPSLAKVLSRVDGRVPIVLEIKQRGEVGALEAATARCLAHYEGDVSVQSFNPRTLVWFRHNAGRYPRGMLSCDFVGEDLPPHQVVVLRRLLYAPAVRPAYVGYDHRSLPYWAPSLLRRLGVPLVAWTIRNEDDLLRARGLADNVIFESVRP